MSPFSSLASRALSTFRLNKNHVIPASRRALLNMNLELRFGYENEPTTYDPERRTRLYAYANNKVGAFFGFIAQGRPTTSFLVYSRGGPGGWLEDDFRANWVAQLEGRFPSLKGKVTTMNVPGGDARGSWRDPETIRTLREHVVSILGIDVEG